jgi:hypothetical protein
VGEHETDVRMAAEGGYESRMSRLDLLESQATSFFHQIDEPEVAGSGVLCNPVSRSGFRLAEAIACTFSARVVPSLHGCGASKKRGST